MLGTASSRQNQLTAFPLFACLVLVTWGLAYSLGLSRYCSFIHGSRVCKISSREFFSLLQINKIRENIQISSSLHLSILKGDNFKVKLANLYTHTYTERAAVSHSLIIGSCVLLSVFLSLLKFSYPLRPMHFVFCNHKNHPIVSLSVLSIKSQSSI